MKRFSALLPFTLLLAMSFASLVHSSPYKVMVVQSYEKDWVWVQEQDRGIDHALEKSGLDIEVQRFWMDSKRKSKPEEVAAAARDAINMIEELKPDLLMTCDENALLHVGKHYFNRPVSWLGKPLPIVFQTINGDPVKYEFAKTLETPSYNVTGMLEGVYTEDTIKLMQELSPNLTKLLVISDDSPSSIPVLDRVDKIKDQLPLKIIGPFSTNLLSEWQRILKKHSDQPDTGLLIVAYHTVKDDYGKAVPREEVSRLILSNGKSKYVEGATWETLVEDGVLICMAVSGYQHGLTAGKKAVSILKGEAPGNIPITVPAKGQIVINWSRAKQLGIKIPSKYLTAGKIYRTQKVLQPSS